MVREVYGVTGDCGVEVLPICLVVFEGLDEVSGRLISRLQDWIRWVAEAVGRESVAHLAEAGGSEVEVGEGGTDTYRPSFNKLHARGGKGELKDRWNVLTFIKGGRREVNGGRAMPAREISKVMKGKEGEADEGKRRRESFENGVSIEGEFAFTKAVSDYC